MIEMFCASFWYILNEPYFWASMSFTVLVGLFIGAVIHNGDFDGAKKTIFSLISYIVLVSSVNLSRILPRINLNSPKEQPFASFVTILIVSFFYFIGIILGVLLIKKAHK